MDRLRLTHHIRESLAGFYRDGGSYFWRVYAETPVAALAAFKAKPEVFGKLDVPYAIWPQSRLREHGRIIALLNLLVEGEGVFDEGSGRPEQSV